MADGEYCAGDPLAVRGWEFSRQHLHQEDAKAEDVHLGGLLAGVTSFRGSIAGIARIFRVELLLEVD